MAKVTRRGVFETNSSSTHSIAIFNGGQPTQQIRPEADGKVHIYPGEFGWGPEAYHDAESKASYAYTWAKNHGDEDAMELLTKVLIKHTGCEVVFETMADEYGKFGYIDHQSVDVCSPAFYLDETLEHFIFNPESVLLVDHDNH